MRSRGFAGPSKCVFCGNKAEEFDHVFGTCNFTSTLVANISEVFDMKVDTSYGFHDILLQILNVTFSPRVLGIWKLTWVTFFWMIWGCRNRVVHDGEIPDISRFQAQLWVFVKEMSLEVVGYNFNIGLDLKCMAFFGMKFKPKPLSVITSVRWAPPPCGIKVNSDGSEVNGQIQGGVVFRNCMGFVVAAFARKMGKGFAYEAELWAAMEGVLMAIKMG